MKKNLFIISLFAACMISFVACNKKDDVKVDNMTPQTETPKEILTADDQKSYLEKVATEFMGYFNTADQKDAAEKVDALIYKFEEYNWETFEDVYETRIETERAKIRPYLAMVSKLAQAQPDESYIYSASQFTGVFRANDKTRTWEYVKDSKNSLELIFNDLDGNSCNAVVSFSGKETQVSWLNTYHDYSYNEQTGSYDIEETYTYESGIKVPSKATFSFKVGSNEIASFTLENEINTEKEVNIDLSVKIANLAFVIQERTSLTKANYAASMKYGDKTLLTITAKADDYNVIGFESSSDIEEWAEGYEEKYDDLFRSSKGGATAEINVLGAVQIVGNLKSIATAYSAYMNFSQRENVDERDFVKWFNQYVPIQVYYGTNEVQANVILATVPYETSYGDTRYDVDVALYFPKDKTTYDIEDYFTERSFGRVIDMAEALVNRYLSLLKYNEVEPIEF